MLALNPKGTQSKAALSGTSARVCLIEDAQLGVVRVLLVMWWLQMCEVDNGVYAILSFLAPNGRSVSPDIEGLPLNSKQVGLASSDQG